MRVSIVGTSYAGLITGVGLAAHGNKVICVDRDAEIIRRLRKGRATIYEKGLPQILRKVWKTRCFTATTDLADAVHNSELTIVTVGTPNAYGWIDLRQIRHVATEIGRILRHKSAYHVVVVKSTVLPGTTDSVVRPILESSSGKKLGEFGLGFNPEFLREGTALDDFLRPDRIVLGADDPRTVKSLRQLYGNWKSTFLGVSTRTAEMIKYASNCLLATQISAVNELANVAAALSGIDIDAVFKGVQLDKRWSPIKKNGTRIRPGILAFLWPGCGFGGSCFSKDVKALLAQGRKLGQPMRMLDAVLKTNIRQSLQIITLLTKALGGLRGKRIAVLGLAFKPGTDDIRESPALRIIRELAKKHCVISAADPVAHKKARKALASLPVNIYSDWRQAVKKADAVVLVTAWDEYRTISSSRLKALMRGNLLVDGRGVWQHLESSGQFEVCRIGHRPRKARK